jgi:hypothetical protein
MNKKATPFAMLILVVARIPTEMTENRHTQRRSHGVIAIKWLCIQLISSSTPTFAAAAATATFTPALATPATLAASFTMDVTIFVAL